MKSNSEFWWAIALLCVALLVLCIVLRAMYLSPSLLGVFVSGFVVVVCVGLGWTAYENRPGRPE